MKKNIRQYIQDCRDFLQSCFFPIYCLGCKQEGQGICNDCFQEISFQPYSLYEQKQDRQSALSNHWAATNFSDELIQKLIHTLKYKQQHTLKQCIKKIVHRWFLQYPNMFSNIDIVCPIPLHRKRKLERGFNQSHIIAQCVSREYGIMLQQVCKRVVQTQQQAGLSRLDRLRNLQNAFEVDKKRSIQGNIVLLVDDVFTTGATMESCAHTLMESGAKAVYGFTLARSFL